VQFGIPKVQMPFRDIDIDFVGNGGGEGFDLTG
jgi:hypothetical protein